MREFDYIIVGGGCAGVSLAYELEINDKLNLTIKCHSYNEISELIKEIKQFIKPNQIILLKGSNGTGLWKLVPIFKNIIQENANAA